MLVEGRNPDTLSSIRFLRFLEVIVGFSIWDRRLVGLTTHSGLLRRKGLLERRFAQTKTKNGEIWKRVSQIRFLLFDSALHPLRLSQLVGCRDRAAQGTPRRESGWQLPSWLDAYYRIAQLAVLTNGAVRCQRFWQSCRLLHRFSFTKVGTFCWSHIISRFGLRLFWSNS